MYFSLYVISISQQFSITYFNKYLKLIWNFNYSMYLVSIGSIYIFTNKPKHNSLFCLP